MAFYWTINSIPELADLPRAEQKRLYRRSALNALGEWQLWLIYILFGVGGSLLAKAVESNGWSPWTGAAIAFIGIVLAVQITHNTVLRRLLREEIALQAANVKDSPS